MVLSTYKIETTEMKKVEKERKIKVLSLVALIVAVLGLTVAFAALSQTLTINGSASVNAAEWDIHFANLSEPTITGDASVSNAPTLEGTTISNFNVSITKPGDSVTYTFDIVNSGTINAKIEEFEDFTLALYNHILDENGADSPYDFNGDGGISPADAPWLYQNFNFGLFYEDGTTKVKIGDTLNAGETKKVKLIVEYKTDSEELPKAAIDIYDNATATINYVQAD